MAYLKYFKQQLICNCRSLTSVPAKECALRISGGGSVLILDVVAIKSNLGTGIFHKTKLVIRLRPGRGPIKCDTCNELLMRPLHRNYRAVTAPKHLMDPRQESERFYLCRTTYHQTLISNQPRTQNQSVEWTKSFQCKQRSYCVCAYKCILDLLTTTHFDNIWNMRMALLMSLPVCLSAGRVSCSFRYLITFQCSFCGQPLDPRTTFWPHLHLVAVIYSRVCGGTLTFLFHLLSNSHVDHLITRGCPYS